MEAAQAKTTREKVVGVHNGVAHEVSRKQEYKEVRRMDTMRFERIKTECCYVC
jgi:hypothetical protein